MKFLALLVTLLLEQARPLGPVNRVYDWFTEYAAGVESRFNAGEWRQGLIAWLVAVVPLLLLTAAIHSVLWHLNPLLGWIWGVAVLYLTMGFRQFSHFFTDIMLALREERLEAARVDLAAWRGASTAEFNASEVARVAIEEGVIASHRHVFGPIVCFIVLGPAGALLYRLAGLLSEKWGVRTDPEYGAFGAFAAQFFHWLDWLPVRATAASFAIVGNFEDAVYCWRTQAAAWANRAQGILLAAAAGAVGVRLGDSLHQDGGLQYRPEMGIGEAADLDYMQSTVGLIWRTIVLWMFLLLLGSIVYALG